MNIKELIKNDLFYIFIVSLMLGLVIGFCCPQKYSAGFKIFMHKIYAKFHPDIQKDTKTIIIETATKNVKEVPQNSIFEEPVKKENPFIIFVKRIFTKKKKDSEMTINDIVIGE